MRNVVPGNSAIAIQVVEVLHVRTAARSVLGSEESAGPVVDGPRPRVGREEGQAVRETPLGFEFETVIVGFAAVVAPEDSGHVRLGRAGAHLVGGARTGLSGISQAGDLEASADATDVPGRDNQVLRYLLLEFDVPLVADRVLSVVVHAPARVAPRLSARQGAAEPCAQVVDELHRLPDRVRRREEPVVVRPTAATLPGLVDAGQLIEHDSITDTHDGRGIHAPSQAEARLPVVPNRDRADAGMVGEADLVAVRHVLQPIARNARGDSSLVARRRHRLEPQQELAGRQVVIRLETAGVGSNVRPHQMVEPDTDVQRQIRADPPLVLSVRAEGLVPEENLIRESARDLRGNPDQGRRHGITGRPDLRGQQPLSGNLGEVETDRAERIWRQSVAQGLEAELERVVAANPAQVPGVVILLVVELERAFHPAQRTDISAGETAAPDGDPGNWLDAVDGAESRRQGRAVPDRFVRQRTLRVGLPGVSETVVHDHRGRKAVEPSPAVIEERELAHLVDELGGRSEFGPVDPAVTEPRPVRLAELMVEANLEVVGVVGRRVSVDNVELGIPREVGAVVIAPQVRLHRLVERGSGNDVVRILRPDQSLAIWILARGVRVEDGESRRPLGEIAA